MNHRGNQEEEEIKQVQSFQAFDMKSNVSKREREARGRGARRRRSKEGEGGRETTLFIMRKLSDPLTLVLLQECEVISEVNIFSTVEG